MEDRRVVAVRRGLYADALGLGPRRTTTREEAKVVSELPVMKVGASRHPRVVKVSEECRTVFLECETVAGSAAQAAGRWNHVLRGVLGRELAPVPAVEVEEDGWVPRRRPSLKRGRESSSWSDEEMEGEDGEEVEVVEEPPAKRVRVGKTRLEEVAAQFSAAEVFQADEELKELLEALKDDVAGVCDALVEDGLSDEAAYLLSMMLFKEADAGVQRSTVFVRRFLAPRVIGLGAPASRVLATTLTEVVRLQPKAVQDGLLEPLWSSMKPGDELHSAVAELLVRVFKDGQVDGARVLEAVVQVSGECWNEPFLRVVDGLIKLKPALGPETAAQLVEQMGVAVTLRAELPKSSKFAQLVLSFVNQYPQLLPALRARLQQVVEKITSFIRRVLLKKLKA